MKSEIELNKVLSDLYNDLEKLQNARTQVESVTKSSDETNKSIEKILSEIKKFPDNISIKIGENEKKISDIYKNYEKKINELPKLIENISKTHQKLIELTDYTKANNIPDKINSIHIRLDDIDKLIKDLNNLIFGYKIPVNFKNIMNRIDALEKENKSNKLLLILTLSFSIISSVGIIAGFVL